MKLLLTLSFAVFFVFSCEEEEGFPITNHLRVIQVKSGTNAVISGTQDLPVLTNFQFIFSHALDVTKLEANLTVTPAKAFSLGYDVTNSFVTLTFDTPLAYDTEYTINLPEGTYGTSGETSIEDFVFEFKTQAFSPPKLTLTSDLTSFYEGDVVTITAKISEVIFSDVTMTLQFAGTATGGGTDYDVSETALTIPAGSTTATASITTVMGDAVEGAETIMVSVTDLTNAIQDPPQVLNLQLGDTAPALELKGIMSLKIGGTSTNGRAVHLRAIEAIADLSVYGIGIANNGGGTDGREIDFPAVSVNAGDDILLVRDIDEVGLGTYFGSCFTGFELVVTDGGVNFNGDDAVELFSGTVVIETFGEASGSATGIWEYTGSWAYKLGDNWIYAGVDCAANSATTETSNCLYPMCSEGLEFQGILSLQPTAGRIRAYHLRALKDIPDLSIFDARIAANGASTFGSAISLPVQEVKEGETILLVRDLDLQRAADYFGSCFSKFDHVISAGSVTSNGNDVIGLHKNDNLIETYGVLGVDGVGQSWEYTDSWGYKVGGSWTYGGVGCTSGVADNASSACPYILCQ